MNFELLETILYDPDQGFYLLDRHLDRLERAAGDFEFAPVDRGAIQAQLNAQVPRESCQRVRLVYDARGVVTVQCTALPETKAASAHDMLLGIDAMFPLDVKLDTQATNTEDPFVQHKTTHRPMYDDARKRAGVGHGGIADVILWNKQNQVTESSIANIAIRRRQPDGQHVWLTPHTQCGLLPGTMRAHLLDQGLIKQAEITTDDLINAQQRGDLMICFNSVRKIYRVVLK